MKASTNLKITLISLTAVFGAATMMTTASAGSIRDKSKVTTQDLITHSKAREIVKTYLKNHKSPVYRSLLATKSKKINGSWNIKIHTADDRNIAIAQVNAKTGKVIFKKY